MAWYMQIQTLLMIPIDLKGLIRAASKDFSHQTAGAAAYEERSVGTANMPGFMRSIISRITN